MDRPDQDRFDLFSRHFEALDPLLGEFAEEHGFQLEKNPNRQPCRILRRTGNPERLIDIYQDDHWRQVEYRIDLPHTIAVAAFYTPPEDPLSLWKLSEMLLEHKPFSALREGLQDCLARATALLAAWTSEVIVGRGQRLRNYRTECQRNLL